MPAKPAAGFTLLEVMITIFVLAFGLLALGAIQLKTYTALRDAEYQSIAALYAGNLAEAMRANAHNITDVNGKVTSDWQHYVRRSAHSLAPPSAQACTGSSSLNPSKAITCSQEALAAYDLYQFKTQLAAAFPHADKVITAICPSNDLQRIPQISQLHCDTTGPLTIKIAWSIKLPSSHNHSLGGSATGSIRKSGYQLLVTP